MLFVYRGRHCPRCKRFLSKLSKALPAWSAIADVVVVSADTQEKALADKAEFGWEFDLCYGLNRCPRRKRPASLPSPVPLPCARTGR